jgi:tetratricopeptide (TPR) repeat protein
MYLRFFGWEGDQFDIANLLKPQRDDRNVNVEELAYYVRTHAGWLQIEYRVGGNLSLLKQILALGIPVMIEESFYFDTPFYPNDDLWAAHYNLLTGYDDLTQTFISQDSYHGANLTVSYQQVEEYWQPFNHVYVLVYPPQFQQQIQAVLGEDWDVTQNRQRALEATQHETEANSQNAFAWFNLGTNLVYFERYADAALAYDQARQLGLPQRMYRYQFGPFFAYFHSGRLDDLMAIVDYALKRTPNSEEALLWRGWAYYRKGDLNAAIADFRAALEQNPNYQDAQYALDFVLNNP